MVFTFTSPELAKMSDAHGLKGSDGYHMLQECPVGVILREAPHVYEAIAAHSYAETGAFNPLESPTYLRQAFGVISSEKSRLREMEMQARRGANDSKFGLAQRRR